MSVWDSRRLKILEERIRETVSGGRHLIDVPYYIYLYKPELELECIKEFKNLVIRLKRDGISAETISLASIMIKALRDLGCLNEEFLKKENQRRKELCEDLKRELLKEISNRLKEMLKDKDVSHCAILLRAGALFPFIHISSLLTRLEGVVRCTLVLPYPGNKEGNMLNYYGTSIRSYYRGEVI